MLLSGTGKRLADESQSKVPAHITKKTRCKIEFMTDESAEETDEEFQTRLRKLDIIRGVPDRVRQYAAGKIQTQLAAVNYLTAVDCQRDNPGEPCLWCEAICDTCKDLNDENLRQFTLQFIAAIEKENQEHGYELADNQADVS